MTATKNTAQEQEGQSLSPGQVQIAAQSGVALIAQGKVDVPSDMAMNGTLTALNGILSALAQGTAILANPQMIQQLQANQKPPAKKPAKKAAKKKAPAKKKTSSRSNKR